MSKRRREGKKLQRILDNINSWNAFWSANKTTYEFAIDFVVNSVQWSGDEQAYYNQIGKKQLTYNVLDKTVNQIVGEQLANLPEITVVASDDEKGSDEAQLREDFIRHLQQEEDARQCYSDALKCMFKGGYGVLALYVEYGEKDFTQRIKFSSRPDAGVSFFDPSATEITKCDGDFCGDIARIDKRAFKRRWPNKTFTTEGFGDGMNSDGAGMMSGETEEYANVAEYYEKQWKTKKIYKVSPTISGKPYDSVDADKFEEYLQEYIESMQEIGDQLGSDLNSTDLPKVIDERMAEYYTIKCYRLTPVEILEEYDFPGRHLPRVFCDGKSTWQNGIQIIKPFCSDAYDAQRQLNYTVSEIANGLRTYTRQTIWATPSMVDGFQDNLKNPERPMAVFLYNPDPMVPGSKPEVVQNPPFPEALVAAVDISKQAIMDILGRSEVSNGDQGNETSGVAIERRLTQQNSIVNAYFDGFMQAGTQFGRLINDLFTELYDEPTEMSFTDRDHNTYQRMINKVDPNSHEIENEVTKNNFHVSMQMSANFEMQAEDERNYLMGMLQASGQPAFPYLANQLAKLSNSPNMPQIVEQIEMMMNPAVMAKINNEPAPPPPPAPPEVALEQQKMQMDAQKMQMESQSNQQKHAIELQEQQIKMMELQMNEMKLRMEFAESRMELHQKAIDADAELKKAHLQAATSLSRDHVQELGHISKTLNTVKDLASMANESESPPAND
jgi:hypothetical protein